MWDAAAARCVECDDTHICVYDKTTAKLLVVDRWCYMQDPLITPVDTIGYFLQSERQPYYHYQFCIDCNHKDNVNQLCTFATNYFTTQPGANLTCPTDRSEIHDVTISGENYSDTRWWNLANYAYPYCV